MKTADSVLQASLLAQCVLALFLAVAFFGPLRTRAPVNGWCGAFFLAYAAVLADRLFVAAAGYRVVPHLTEVLTPVELLFPPLLYLVVDCCVRGQRSVLRRHMPHFVPFLVGLLLRIPIFTLSGADKAQWEGAQLIPHESLAQWRVELADAADEAIDLLFLITVTTYLVLSIRRLRTHVNNLHDIHSDTAGKSLNWLAMLVWVYALVWFFMVFNADIAELGTSFSTAVAVAELLALFTLALCAIAQHPVYTSGEALGLASLVPESSQKYKKSALDEKSMERMAEKLEAYMGAEQPYLEPGLTLPRLAKGLGVKTNYLSQTINARYQRRFHDFVNGYRVEAACDALRSNPKTAIIDIAMSCGFTSKSTFNAVFKKLTGATPTEYRRQQEASTKRLPG